MNSRMTPPFSSLSALVLGFVFLSSRGMPSARAEAPDQNTVYDQNCALCHQKGGRGVSGQFPRLAGRVDAIAATDSGRRYLIDVVLFGMAGQVEIDRIQIVGVMPPFAMLSDEELASVLNYVTHLEGSRKQGSKPGIVNAADVAGERVTKRLSPTQVHDIRKSVLH
jgi:mono/diheme cytochrome c family protein